MFIQSSNRPITTTTSKRDARTCLAIASFHNQWLICFSRENISSPWRGDTTNRNTEPFFYIGKNNFNFKPFLFGWKRLSISFFQSQIIRKIVHMQRDIEQKRDLKASLRFTRLNTNFDTIQILCKSSLDQEISIKHGRFIEKELFQSNHSTRKQIKHRFCFSSFPNEDLF